MFNFQPFLLAPGHIQPQYLVRSHGSHSLPKYLHDEPLPPAPDEGHLYPVTLLHPGHHYTMPRQAPRTRQERSVEVKYRHGTWPSSHIIMNTVGWSAGPLRPQVPGPAHHVRYHLAREVSGKATKICAQTEQVGVVAGR